MSLRQSVQKLLLKRTTADRRISGLSTTSLTLGTSEASSNVSVCVDLLVVGVLFFQVLVFPSKVTPDLFVPKRGWGGVHCAVQKVYHASFQLVKKNSTWYTSTFLECCDLSLLDCGRLSTLSYVPVPEIDGKRLGSHVVGRRSLGIILLRVG